MKDELVKSELAISSKFEELIKDLDIIKMADAGIMDITSLSDKEKEDIIIWIHNDDNNVPQIIKEYIDKCK